FQAEDGIRDFHVTGVQTCALPILMRLRELERIDEYLARLDEDMRQANRRALAFLDYRLRAPDRLDVLLRRAARGALAADENALQIGRASGRDRAWTRDLEA